MDDFKPLIKLLQETVDKFQQVIPDIQRAILDRLRVEIADLSLSSGNIIINAANVRKIAAIKAKIESIVLTASYKNAVKEYIAAYEVVNKLQNSYFNALVNGFTPPDIYKALQKESISSVVQDLTERGIQANVVVGIEDILRKNITTGGSYSDLQQSLENNILGNKSDGSLERYTKQITTDAINQYSAQYTQIISSDLGLEWYYYAGSTLTTSREFCLACVEKRYIHISEFPLLLIGDFPEFKKYNGKLYKGKPSGMILNTTVATLSINRGGYGCGHQMRPVSESLVPLDIRNTLYATAEYKAWAAIHKAS